MILFIKKIEIEYKNILNNPHPNQQIVTRLSNKRNKAFMKSRQSANESSKANRRAKNAYSNTVNTLLLNPSAFNPKKSKDIIFSRKSLNNSPPIILNNT